MRHLLSDNTDPFNRQKLTPEMLVPQVQYGKRACALGGGREVGREAGRRGSKEVGCVAWGVLWCDWMAVLGEGPGGAIECVLL
jgi:hypothetical protein